MSNLILFLQLLPSLLKIVEAFVYRSRLHTDEDPKSKAEMKRSLELIAKAIKEDDEKSLNDMFRSI